MSLSFTSQAPEIRLRQFSGAQLVAAALALAWLVFGAGAVQATALSAEMVLNDTTRTLVSNSGQGADAAVQVGVLGTNSFSYAQQFTTGDHRGEYTLTGVGAALSNVGSDAVPKVSIYRDSSGQPGTGLYVLSTPRRIRSGSVNTFTAPEDATLSAETRYWVVFENESTGSTTTSHYHLGTTDSDGEDAGEASGWSIADNRLFRTRNDASWVSRSAELRIAVEGILNADAALASMELQDSEGDSVALVPPFSYRTHGYTAYVDNDVAEITLTEEKSDDGATVKYLDGSGNAITDQDSEEEGLQVSLGEGDTKVQVKVTAADGATTRTYTVIVTRLPATSSTLVSNKGKASAIGRLPNIIAQAFLTGPSATGYRLSGVELDLDSTSSDLLVRIAPRQADMPNPDLSNSADIITLGNPGTITSGFNEYTAPAGTTLSPNTIYYIVISNSDGTAGPEGNALYTTDTDEDAGGASGWTVENHRLYRAAPADEWTYIAASAVKIGVNGHTIASRDTSLSHLRVTDADGNLLALTPAFTPDTTAYKLSVPGRVDEITVFSPTRHFRATLHYRTPFHDPVEDSDNERDGHQVSLNIGRNAIEVIVTAEDGDSTRFYELEVTRAPISSDATLSGLDLTYDDSGSDTDIALTPAFSADTHSYSASVGCAVVQITVSPARNDDTATVAFLDAASNPVADADGTEDGQQAALTPGTNTIRIRVTAEDDATIETYAVTVTRTDDPNPAECAALSSQLTVVPGNWPLIPAGLGPGDEFRLLAKTKNPLKPNQTSTDIADYNDYVQEQVRSRGHTSVQDHASSFRVLGSTAAVNARTNTGTTGSGGVPIYWLNGLKVADDYDDFYDGSWSNKYSGRGVAGDLIEGSRASGRQLLCTGTADDGTTTNLPLGGGDPDGDGTSECTATSIAIRSSTLGGDVLDVSGRARYLALSNVFRVGSSTVPSVEDVSITSDAGSDKEYKVGDVIRIAATFSEALTVAGTPEMVFRVDAMNTKRELVEHNRKARYVAGESTSTVLAFTYTVRSTDFDRNGIRVAADGLDLSGGTITNAAGDTEADLSHKGTGIQSRHRIHVPARVTGVSVVSTPNEGTSYSTGETITIEVAFNKNVRAITDNGTPSYEMLFGVPYGTTKHYAAYARVVGGNKVQFDYVVQADDSDPDGFVASDPAIHWNRGIITLDEVDDAIALAVRADVFETYLNRQDGHAVNAE